MKKMIRPLDDSVIRVTMYIRPIIYEQAELIFAAGSYDATSHKYHTDINPNRTINGPLSPYHQELETPIREEYENFIDDCKWLINEVGFTIIDTHTSEDSDKSEYILTFGMKDQPCGTLVYNLRISDHPYDATFPEEWKEKAEEYLKVNHILDAEISRDGISFEIEKVTVGTVANDTWDKAFTRLYQKLRQMKRKVRTRLSATKD